jgi:hypothetical protein
MIFGNVRLLKWRLPSAVPVVVFFYWLGYCESINEPFRVVNAASESALQPKSYIAAQNGHYNRDGY